MAALRGAAIAATRGRTVLAPKAAAATAATEGCSGAPRGTAGALFSSEATGAAKRVVARMAGARVGAEGGLRRGVAVAVGGCVGAGGAIECVLAPSALAGMPAGFGTGAVGTAARIDDGPEAGRRWVGGTAVVMEFEASRGDSRMEVMRLATVATGAMG